MLIDFSRNLYTVEGKIFPEDLGTEMDEEGKNVRKTVPMTVRTIVSGALQAPLQSDGKMDAKQREALFDLLMKIHGDPVVDLESEEITKLKNRVVQLGFNNVLTGQVLKILEGKPNPLEPIKENPEKEPIKENPEKEPIKASIVEEQDNSVDKEETQDGTKES